MHYGSACVWKINVRERGRKLSVQEYVATYENKREKSRE